MMEKGDNKKKKRYEKPQVIFERELEAFATVCDAIYAGQTGCQKGSCTTPSS